MVKDQSNVLPVKEKGGLCLYLDRVIPAKIVEVPERLNVQYVMVKALYRQEDTSISYANLEKAKNME